MTAGVPKFILITFDTSVIIVMTTKTQKAAKYKNKCKFYQTRIRTYTSPLFSRNNVNDLVLVAFRSVFCEEHKLNIKYYFNRIRAAID